MPVLETKGAISAQGFGLTLQQGEVNYIEDVFSTWLYTGNDTSQAINNGINLAGNGGMVWFKRRNASEQHNIYDSARGWDAGGELITNTINAAQDQNSGYFAASATGFSFPTVVYNGSGNTYASWTFRKQPKFFDVVTWSGNGTVGRQIAHNLGSEPGCIIVKRTNLTGGWFVYHRSLGASQAIRLEEIGAASGTAIWNSTAPTSTVFTVNNSTAVNASGSNYVAYLFAHDAGGFGLSGADNVISCGSTGGSKVTLGWEPQWILYKSSNFEGDWEIVDNMRGLPVGAVARLLKPNAPDAEINTTNSITISSDGFALGAIVGTAIYIAIRRGPMKVPTIATSVFTPVAYSGNDANRVITAGFPIDMAMIGMRNDVTSGKVGVFDRLRGRLQLLTTQTAEETTADGLQTIPWDSMTGIDLSGGSGVTNFTPFTYVDWNFRRAPGFFDEVCYTGNGPGTQVVNHNLTVVPELVINKVRSTTSGWTVFQGDTTALTGFLRLNETSAAGGDTLNVSSTTITVNSTIGFGMNTSGQTYVTYLFASCPGVSKVGRFTGTGATQVINCGFTGGARFVLIKARSTTGNWLVWDSARGIVAGDDPYLALNSTAAEVTNTDWVDTAATGFELSNAAGNLANSNGVTYIFLAIA